ncbi:MAG: hypothetical protein J6K98_01455 [Clostridia bacterium]|nr:hypothetical protein [Clostridia bacterium]
MKRVLKDNRAVHCLGNGRICGYGRGLDLFQVFGPHYSAPNGLSLTFASEGDWQYESVRQPETAIWTHTLYQGEDAVGTLTEFADSTRPIISRRVRGAQPLCFRATTVGVERFYKVDEEVCGYAHFFVGEIPEGSPFYPYSYNEGIYHNFVIYKPLHFGLLVTGDGVVDALDGKNLEIAVADGEITLVFAESFDDLMAQVAYVTETAWPERKTRTAALWQTWSTARKANCPAVPETLARLYDDIYVLIKTQQSVSGGVLAGYPYHLAYVRDNYGVNRGLLALGAYEESKALMRFYIDVFKRYGEFHNAQGTDSYAFHIHEIDKTEITGYMVLMILEYYRRSGDTALLLEAKELLWWCVTQQHSLLRNGMLPFNGDETYIAGYILPREVINHGSMEATMLYHTGCVRLSELAEVLVFSESQKALLAADQETIEEHFAENFYVDGRIACNNRHYYEEGTQPKFRNGIRMCGHGLGVGVLDKSNRYVCWDCYHQPPQENKAFETTYFLSSPVLMSIYVDSALLDRELVNRQVDKIAEELVKNDFVYKPDKTVGYDLGILIYAFRERHRELIPRLKDMVLDMRDELGTWSEYYVNNLPNGTMYRPWESGINFEALLLEV